MSIGARNAEKKNIISTVNTPSGIFIGINDMYFKSARLLMILTVLHTHHCFNKEYDRSHSYECTSSYLATYKCNLHNGMQVPVINNNDDFKYVTDMMRAHKLDSAWLGLYRTFLPEYLWLDCTKPPEIFLEQDWGGISRCVNLNVQEAQLEVSPCNFTKGVICQVPECTLCSQPHINCKKIDDRCFISTCALFSWEAGKAHCRSEGFEIAILENNWFKHHPVYNFEAFFGKGCRHYWVGLRKQEWEYKYSDVSNMTNVFWAKGEPGSKGNCSIIKRSGERFNWKAVSCNERHPVLCVPVRKSRVTTPTVKPTTVQEHTPDDQSKVVKNSDFTMHSSIHWAVWISAFMATTTVILIGVIYVKENMNTGKDGKGPDTTRLIPKDDVEDNMKIFAPQQMQTNKRVKYVPGAQSNDSLLPKEGNTAAMDKQVIQHEYNIR